MTHFYETQMGHRFFNGQLPALIHALENIAEALSGPIPTDKLPQTNDTDILQELYFGTYEPDLFKRSEKISSLDRQVILEENSLLPLLDSIAAEQFETYQAAVSARDSAVAEQAYKAGFQLAVDLPLSGRLQPASGNHQTGGEQHVSN